MRISPSNRVFLFSFVHSHESPQGYVGRSVTYCSFHFQSSACGARRNEGQPPRAPALILLLLLLLFSPPVLVALEKIEEKKIKEEWMSEHATLFEKFYEKLKYRKFYYTALLTCKQSGPFEGPHFEVRARFGCCCCCCCCCCLMDFPKST